MKDTLRFLSLLIRWTTLGVCCVFALSGLTAISPHSASIGSVSHRQSRIDQSTIPKAKASDAIQRLRAGLVNLPNHAAFDFWVLPAPQAGTSKIAFTSNRDGSAQIYLMNTDGSGQTRLTYNGSNDDNPRWSPNGTKILFQSDRDNPETGLADVYVMNADGSGQTRLTSDANDDSAAVWSPDGNKIAFQSARNGVNYQVHAMNADGSGQVNIGNSVANDTQPSWSPDGARIAFASDRDQAGFSSIYVMNANGSNQTRLTFSGSGVRDEQPSWSPDGMKLAFTSTRDSIVETWQETDDDGNIITKSKLDINKEVYVMNADGSGQTRLTNDLANDDSPSWSPDGSKIVFRSDRERDCCDPTAQVWTMNPDGNNQISLSNNEFNDYSASWTGGNSSGSQLADYSPPGGNQPPVANAGGSHVGLAGQAVQFNGSGSFDPDGSIVTYSWNFGDGTSSTGPNPTHQYNVDGVYSVWLSVCDNNGTWSSSQGFVTVDSVNLPVRLTFDELPNNTVVADQYFNQYGVRFSSANFFFPVHTYQNCGFCSTTSPPNFINTKLDDSGQVMVEFTQPVSNLTFYIVGVDAFFNPFAILDVYRNGSLNSTFTIFGNGTSTVGISLGSTNNISKIVIREINDVLGVGFDDFTFSVTSDIKITSARVSGYLNGTTQNALLGADVALQASPLPGGFAGGTYAWTCTPSTSCSIITGANSSSVTLRTNEVSTYTANVSYTKNGLNTTGSVTINSVLPTLTSFTAQQGSGTVSSPGTCNRPFPASFWWFYQLGCRPSSVGISFLSLIHAPTTFISDPAQSGVKYVQAVSAFHKRVARGLRCETHRSDESNIASGWQLDSHDPYAEISYRYFSILGSPGMEHDFSIVAEDYPGRALTEFNDWDFVDSLFVDHRFEMYLVYFTGSDPAHPSIQRPLGKIKWNWGGLVVFDWNGTDVAHHIRSTNATSPVFEPTNSMVTMHGNVADTQGVDFPCPSGPPLTANRIDSSREFVKYHYIDFLGRNPAGDPTHAPDIPGWDFWTSQISQCVFDFNCIYVKRINTGLAFFYSSEFIQSDPDMANPPGSPGFNPNVYNRAFVRYCYLKYLKREPEQSGWDFWTNVLNSDGDYGHMIDAFQLSIEYRNRQFQ